MGEALLVGVCWSEHSNRLSLSCVFQGLTPYEFVESMKKKGIRVPGIGHRYREFSTFNIFQITRVY